MNLLSLMPLLMIMLFMPSFGDAAFGVFFVMWLLMMLFLIMRLGFQPCHFSWCRVLFHLSMLLLLVAFDDVAFDAAAFDHGF